MLPILAVTLEMLTTAPPTLCSTIFWTACFITSQVPCEGEERNVLTIHSINIEKNFTHLQVDFQHQVEIAFVHFQNHRVSCDASAVYDCRRWAFVLVDCFFEDILYAFRVRYIEFNGKMIGWIYEDRSVCYVTSLHFQDLSHLPTLLLSSEHFQNFYHCRPLCNLLGQIESRLLCQCPIQIL